MQPDEARLELTADWMRKARQDLRAAEVLHSAEFPDVVVYHCQQAMEKALKAYLAWLDIPFARTHDLEQLHKECVAADASFADAQQAAYALLLSPYAYKYRYPSDEEEPSSQEEAEALAAARAAVAFVAARLPPSARP